MEQLTARGTLCTVERAPPVRHVYASGTINSWRVFVMQGDAELARAYLWKVQGRAGESIEVDPS